MVCTQQSLAGASFSVHPMSDDYKKVIKQALTEVNTSHVTLQTDDVNSTVQGTIPNVFDVTRAICGNAAATKKHVAFQATYSLGCPGNKKRLSETATQLLYNALPQGVLDTFVAAKFALYPLGDVDYMTIIKQQLAYIPSSVVITPHPYSTKLEGSFETVFQTLQQCFEGVVEAGSSHTVMTVTISIHSPSHS